MCRRDAVGHLARPAHKTVIKRLPRTIDRRCIRPAATGLQDVDDARDHPAVIDPGLAARIGRKMWLKPRELFRRQPKIMHAHHWFPFGNLESQTNPFGNPLYGSGA